jgi:hypothetical protein
VESNRHFGLGVSYLWDVANMLRYAHKMPPEFQDAFLKGLGDGGIILPENWRVTVNLLNLLSLLDVLKRSDPKDHSHQCADIRELIDCISLELSSMQKIDRVEITPYDPNWQPKPYDPNWPHIYEKEAVLHSSSLWQ